ncbi:hypothetical protein AAII07_31935 [Microvirga sp. 0TCS3.31]
MNTLLAEAIAKARSRSSWNDRLEHWARPASDHEEDKIQRAARMARAVVLGNKWLAAEGVTIQPQGSYFNNTNVRLDSDMDLRAQHSAIKVEYGAGIAAEHADSALGYYGTGRTFPEVALDMRRQLGNDLTQRFGAGNVEIGNKAIAVAGLSGSRADVDVVPAFRLHWVQRTQSLLSIGDFFTTEGVAILGTDGSWTYNFPEQHHANGKAKRESTGRRFKKVVRMLKRLNYDLVDVGFMPKKLPSFLIESLVYNIEDYLFLYKEDHYARLKRIVTRISEQVDNPFSVAIAKEVNGIKPLFSGQPWTTADVKVFVAAALLRLEI